MASPRVQTQLATAFPKDHVPKPLPGNHSGLRPDDGELHFKKTARVSASAGSFGISLALGHQRHFPSLAASNRGFGGGFV